MRIELVEPGMILVGHPHENKGCVVVTGVERNMYNPRTLCVSYRIYTNVGDKEPFFMYNDQSDEVFVLVECVPYVLK